MVEEEHGGPVQITWTFSSIEIYSTVVSLSSFGVSQRQRAYFLFLSSLCNLISCTSTNSFLRKSSFLLYTREPRHVARLHIWLSMHPNPKKMSPLRRVSGTFFQSSSTSWVRARGTRKLAVLSVSHYSSTTQLTHTLFRIPPDQKGTASFFIKNLLRTNQGKVHVSLLHFLVPLRV
jgi:hypothetical protein